MKVRFTLTMDYVVAEFHGEKYMADQLILEWDADMEEHEILELSHQWITSRNFLTTRMIGLTRVGESALTIEPLDEADFAAHGEM